uniref:Uncharacterized protein n=1 Tax=Rhizophora mucronata TaxID=61149 RepID=A0A2P2PUH9_RHIMU
MCITIWLLLLFFLGSVHLKDFFKFSSYCSFFHCKCFVAVIELGDFVGWNWYS